MGMVKHKKPQNSYICLCIQVFLICVKVIVEIVVAVVSISSYIFVHKRNSSNILRVKQLECLGILIYNNKHTHTLTLYISLATYLRQARLLSNLPNALSTAQSVLKNCKANFKNFCV